MVLPVQFFWTCSNSLYYSLLVLINEELTQYLCILSAIAWTYNPENYLQEGFKSITDFSICKVNVGSSLSQFCIFSQGIEHDTAAIVNWRTVGLSRDAISLDLMVYLELFHSDMSLLFFL